MRLRGERVAPQNLGHAPRLRDAATRRERRLRIEDLADRSDAAFVQMRNESVEEPPGLRAFVGMYFEPCIHERPDQPGPDGALMIGGVPRTKIPIVPRLVIFVTATERPQPNG